MSSVRTLKTALPRNDGGIARSYDSSFLVFEVCFEKDGEIYLITHNERRSLATALMDDHGVDIDGPNVIVVSKRH